MSNLLYPSLYPNAAVTNITPFTYRDGITYLEKLEALTAYVIYLSEAIDAEIATYHKDPRYQRITATAVTTSAGAAYLKQDDGSGLVVPDKTTQSFIINLVARRVDGTTNESAGYAIQGVIERGVGAATTVLVGSYSITGIEDFAAWAVDLTANPTTGSLDIAVLGEAGKTISWVAAIQMASVSV